jgi:hypothetical protein
MRHYRGDTPIDRPLAYWHSCRQKPQRVKERLFWCGPLTNHFGHQIADFGSRVLRSSIDPRDGELLWMPWLSSCQWQNLEPWQRSLIWYLNPGHKPVLITNDPIIANELIIWPQQARMRALPTASHLEALSWCEQRLPPISGKDIIYVSRVNFAPCNSHETLKGAFAAESLFEAILRERGVAVVYPETISLEEQIQTYRQAKSIIIAEGSAQHGLELLGYHPRKKIVLICRRPQQRGMELPLLARFPQLEVVQAVQQLWFEANGVSWNGLSLIDWNVVANSMQKKIGVTLSQQEISALSICGSTQLRKLASQVELKIGS